jgi:transcriptional regulator with XRE-family HTH domain
VKPVLPRIRFREARERAGLSHDQVAAQCGLPIGAPAVWDIEGCEDDLPNYSPSEIRQLCNVLGIRPTELFGESSEPPLSPPGLAALIRNECQLRGLTLEQFGDVVGWDLSACIDPPEKLVENISIDGLQWLSRELRVDWRSTL